MKLYRGCVAIQCGEKFSWDLLWDIQCVSFGWIEYPLTWDLGGELGDLCRPGSFEEFFSGMFGISSFLCTNLFSVKYSWDGKSQGCWVGMSIVHKMTSGLTREKPESADSSKSIEYVLYKSIG
jgi:hypothetical protein